MAGKPIYWIPQKVDIVEDYLFGNNGNSTGKDIASKYGLARPTISAWSTNDKILIELARRKGMGYEEIVLLREKKKNVKKSLETRVIIVEDYIFGDDTVRSEYGVTSTAIRFWYNEEDVIEGVARKRGLTYQEVIALRDEKVRSNRTYERFSDRNSVEFEVKVASVEAYLFGTRSTVETAKDISKKYGMDDTEITDVDIANWYRSKKVLTEVARRNGISYEEIVGKREDRIRLGKRVIPLEEKLRAVEAYVFEGMFQRGVGEKFGVQQTSVAQWSKDDKVLRELSRKTGKSYQEIIEARNKRQHEFSFEIKVDTVETYLFSNAIKREFIQDLELDVHVTTFDHWYNDNEVLKEVAKRRNLTLEEIIVIRDKKIGGINSQRIKDAPSFREFIETHEDAQKAVALFAFSKDSVDPLAGRVMALWYSDRLSEEDAIEYLPSLGPYLGKYRKPIAPDIFEGVVSNTPKVAIDRDEMLREGFLKIGRDYYLSLMMDKEYPTTRDEDALVELVRERSEGMENESLRWLYGELYSEFDRFITMARRIRERRQQVRT